jgi:hypothetical protein
MSNQMPKCVGVDCNSRVEMGSNHCDDCKQKQKLKELESYPKESK